MHLMRCSRLLPDNWLSALKSGLRSGLWSGLLLSAIVLNPVQTVAADVPSLARLSFWVAPEQMADFD